jgi:hypothetical protein
MTGIPCPSIYVGPTSDTEDQTPVAQDIDRCSVFRLANTVVEGQQADSHPEVNPLGALRCRCCDDQRRGHNRKFGGEVQFGQPDSIEAKAIAVLDLAQGLAIALALGLPRSTRQLKEKAEFHHRAPLHGNSALQRHVLASPMVRRPLGRL